MKKKAFDAVAAMREARRKLAGEWERKPREEEIDCLRRKYSAFIKGKKLARH